MQYNKVMTIIFILYDRLQYAQTTQCYNNNIGPYTGLSPKILLSYRNKDHRVSYELYMGSDGSTFIDRVERIEISNNNSNYILAHKGKLPQLHDVKPRLYLKWSLGELLFNRQA
jgi:hypothetical protein